MAAITSAQQTALIQYVVGLYGAAAGGYIQELSGYVTNQGYTVDQVGLALAGSNSFKGQSTALSDASTNSQWIDAFCTELLGSTVAATPLASLKSQMQTILDANSMSRAALAQLLVSKLANASTTDPDFGTAAQTFQNKVAVASYYTYTLGGTSTALSTLQGCISNVTATTDVSSPTAIQNVINSSPASTTGQTYTLTTGVDTILGTSGNDTINGLLAGTGGTGATLTALDSIDGAGGLNTLNITDTVGGAALPAGLTLANVQTVNMRSAGGVGAGTGARFDLSAYTSVSSISVTQSSGLDYLMAGSGQALSVVDSTTGTGGAVDVVAANAAVTVNAASTVTVAGGSTQTITSKGGAALSGATGAISLTDSALGTGTISVAKGTTVSVTATNVLSSGTGGTGVNITIGTGTALASGAITLVENLAGGTGVTGTGFGGAISVTGGTTVSVTENATQATTVASGTGANPTLTQANVTVNGGAATTSVTVNQTAAVAVVSGTGAVAGVNEVDTITFGTGGLGSGAAQVFGGLTFTASSALTQAQVDAAFANLAAGATQGSSTLGVYSGVFGTGTSGSYYTTGAAGTGGTLSVTAVSAGTGLTFGTGSGYTVASATAGVAAVTAVAGVGGIANGVVKITDAAAGSGTPNTISSVTLNAYGSGSTVASDALTSLSLANTVASDALTVTNAAATASTLDLTVNKLGSGNTLSLAGSGAASTLKIHTTGADSSLAITDANLQTLTIDGTNAINLGTGAIATIKTVTVSGAAGVTANFSGTGTTDVNASATSGAVTASIDASKATYEGGSGVDTITLTSATVSKAISLGDGNDTLNLANGTTVLTSVVDGGAGTNTLAMSADDAITASATTAFGNQITNFGALTLNAGTGTGGTVNLANLDAISSVTLNSVGTGALTLSTMANAGTLTLVGTGSAATTVAMTNATGTGDSFNINVAMNANYGSGVTVNGVETVNIASNNTGTGIGTGTLTLNDDKLASISITGSQQLNLTATATGTGGNSTSALTSVNASGMTGGLTYTTLGGVAETVSGGAGNDTLLATYTGDVLNGGAGNDVLSIGTGVTTSASLVTLTGGGGADTFKVGSATTNVNSYAVITDFTAGDYLDFSAQGSGTGAQSFKAAAISLASTAVFQDYANTAIASTGTGVVSWFQYGGNTYVVDNISGSSTAFQNNKDVIVELQGLVNLSTATINKSTQQIMGH